MTEVSNEHRKMPWYVKAFVAAALVASACLVTGCGGRFYLHDNGGDVGVCVGITNEGVEDGEKEESENE